MKKLAHKSGWARSTVAQIVGGVLALTLISVTPASASFETVATFGEMKETSPLFTTEGAAVNVTGAGGVPAGTLYTVGHNQTRVVRFGAAGHVAGQWNLPGAQAVAVDQVTGYVYVRLWGVSPGVDQILVYNADGSKLITSFGQTGDNFTETFADSPEKIHQSTLESSGLAVDGAGRVYVSDESLAEELFARRVMVFEPSAPGDYEHYVYSGAGRDIATSDVNSSVDYSPRGLAVDAEGNIYVNGGLEAIYEFAPDNPSVPVCKYVVPGGGVQGITVDPVSGRVYYFTYKHKTKIFQLSSCNTKGEFVATGSFVLTPPVEYIYAMAFDPALAYVPSRPAGILYGIGYEGLGYILAPAEVRAPVVDSESASSVGVSSATLTAQVDPSGSPTRYVFQYITDTAYKANKPGESFVGASEAPLGGGEVGSGSGAVSVSGLLLGLEPDTDYHYRVIATSHCNPENEAEKCEGVGAAQSFRTYPLERTVLPDGRAYELVSPPEKDGGEVFPLYPGRASCGTECKPGLTGQMFPRQSSPDGDSVVYQGFSFSAGEGAATIDEYLSKRTASGWRTTILSPAQQIGGYVGFDAALKVGVLEQNGSVLSIEAPINYSNLYKQVTDDPSTFAPMITVQPPDRLSGNFRLKFAGGSEDYSRMFFEADDALTGETSLAPAAVDGGEHKNNLYESVGDELRLINVLPGNGETMPGAAFGAGVIGTTSDFSHAISNDGSRVFWSDEAGRVYARENGEVTVAIPDEGRFRTASADGSKVLLSDGHIYNLVSEQIVDLTNGQGGFQGVLGQSEDLSHVYFVDTAVLSGEETNSQGAKAQANSDNLYAWYEGTLSFVVTLEPGNNEDWAIAPQTRKAQASPNGRWVAFESASSLTGFDNSCSTGHCGEVFLYDSADDGLFCASCSPTGVRPLGSSSLPLVIGAPGSFAQPHYFTDEGRLYFDSRDSLSRFDTNNGAEDVYEYEPNGVGSCGREPACVSLISGGRGPGDSNFLAADATGKNVFFTTRDPLVAADHDELMDVYDAREGGGIRSQIESEQASECHGEACQPPAVAASDPALGSLSFEGPSDLVSSPVGPVKQRAKGLTRTQKLERALRACRDKPRRTRVVCEIRTRRRFARKTSTRRSVSSQNALGKGKRS